MTSTDIETTHTANTVTISQRIGNLLRAAASAYVATYEPMLRSGATVDASIRLRCIPVA